MCYTNPRRPPSRSDAPSHSEADEAAAGEQRVGAIFQPAYQARICPRKESLVASIPAVEDDKVLDASEEAEADAEDGEVVDPQQRVAHRAYACEHNVGGDEGEQHRDLFT